MAAVTEALPAYRQLEQMKLRCQAAVAASLANEPIATQRRYDADVRSSVRNGLMEKSNRGDRNKPSLERWSGSLQGREKEESSGRMKNTAIGSVRLRRTWEFIIRR